MFAGKFCSSSTKLSSCPLCFQVEFVVADITTADYAPESFDVIYSRDTILHIADKESLFKEFLVCHFFFGEWMSASIEDPSELWHNSCLTLCFRRGCKIIYKEAMCSRLLEHTKFLQFFIQFKLKYAIKSSARCRLVLVVNKIHHSIISHITLYMPPCICTLHFHKFQLSDWL